MVRRLRRPVAERTVLRRGSKRRALHLVLLVNRRPRHLRHLVQGHLRRQVVAVPQPQPRHRRRSPLRPLHHNPPRLLLHLRLLRLLLHLRHRLQLRLLRDRLHRPL